MTTRFLSLATLLVMGAGPALVAQPDSTAPAARRISLDGEWAMSHAEPGIGLGQGYALMALPQGEWLPCAVPGSAQAAMFSAGKIPDPYYARQNLDNQWMENKEWWFRREFSIEPRPGARYRLEFDGVDHYATVYLNGEELGRHTGMFDPFELDVTDRLQVESPNVICVRVDPPPTIDKANKELRSQVYNCSQAFFHWAYVHMKTIGIWKPVRLVEVPVAEIRHPFIRTLEQNASSARLRVSGQVDASRQLKDARVKIELTGANCDAAPQSFSAPVGDSGFDTTIEVADPQLWWPNGLGRQNLYFATLSLVDADGTPLDTQTIRIGIRTITTIRNPDSHPDWYDWTYVVNGKPFFARGTNYIPPVDVMLRPMPDKGRHMVWMANQAGMNMFRIWSGGTLETEEFFGLCDEYGILTQEESPLGMSTLDSEVDPELYREVVTGQVLATRNHPSVAIYCGGNEWNAEQPRNKVLVEILREVTTELDGTRIFRPVSPWGGNSHNYSVGGGGGGGDYYIYNRDAAPFVSEAGNWSSPCYETLMSFIPEHEQKAWPPARDSSFAYHTIYNNSWCIDLILYHAGEYGALRNYGDLPTQSMLTKARADSYMAGHVRSAWPKKSGVTIWELKDVWPAITTSNIDYHGIPKTAYFFLKRAYAPLAIISHLAVDWWPAGSTFSAEIHVVSDRETVAGCTVQAEIYDARLNQLASREFTVNVAADASTTVGTFEWPLPPGWAEPFLYVATLRRPDGTVVASEPYWQNLAALLAYQAPDRDKITFDLGDPEQPNAILCVGQEIRFEPIVGHVAPTQEALAFLVASAGSGEDGIQAEFELDYHGRKRNASVLFPDWESQARWADGKIAPGPQLDLYLDGEGQRVAGTRNLHLVFMKTDEDGLRSIKLPQAPAQGHPLFVVAAAVKQDHHWKQLDLANLLNADLAGREGVASPGDLPGGSAFDAEVWPKEVTLVAPDRRRTRLMDVMTQTTLEGRLETVADGQAKVRVRNTGNHPAFLVEVHVGRDALASHIPDDNYFWLAPGEEKLITLHQSPAAQAALDSSAVTLRAWNASATPLEGAD